jgi:hypothetical protein
MKCVSNAVRIDPQPVSRTEAIVVEQVILGIFLVLPLVIVAALFSDELWQEHRRRHPRDEHAAHIDWRHPLKHWRRGH